MLPILGHQPNDFFDQLSFTCENNHIGLGSPDNVITNKNTASKSQFNMFFCCDSYILNLLEMD